jgi:hypothetical protein
MQFLPILIAIALGLLALGFVLYPFYRRAPANPKTAQKDSVLPVYNGHGQGASITSSPERLQPLPDTTATDREREDAARAALREIELDYHLGNIEEADYRNLRERYMRRAIAALKSRYERGHELDDAIEARLQSLKERNMDTSDHAE